MPSSHSAKLDVMLKTDRQSVKHRHAHPNHTHSAFTGASLFTFTSAHSLSGGMLRQEVLNKEDFFVRLQAERRHAQLGSSFFLGLHLLPRVRGGVGSEHLM